MVDSNNHLIIGVPQVIMHGVEHRQLNLLVMHGVEDKLNLLVMHGELRRKQRLHQQMHGEVEKQKLNNQVLGVVVQVRLKLMMRHQEEEHGGRVNQQQNRNLQVGEVTLRLTKPIKRIRPKELGDPQKQLRYFYE